MFTNPGVIGFLVAIIVVVIFLYNRFVVLRQRVNNAWSQIDVNLKRRFDLIPNLVETVKAYASHEEGVFTEIVAARNIVNAAGSKAEIAEAEGELTNTLKHLFAVAESYPNLKANENFLSLQKELAETENKIMFSRQFYNDTVQKYNTKIELFPNNILAKILKFSKADYFDFVEGSVQFEKK
ncbi:MAG: LemA family protein [Eubacteriales bacterium]|jgi:LemA protein|nr:LemA family protein [Eubacteriales bacterium]